MKRTTMLLTLAAVAMAAFISCDPYIEKKIETMYSGFMTGSTDSEGYVAVLTNDFGTQYMVTEKSEQLDPDTTYRLVASVALSENQTARIIQMAPTISYRAPLDKKVPDSIRINDPLEIVSYYIGGGYLNVNLGIKVSREDTQHRLLYTVKDSLGNPKFTIYHKAYGDQPVYTKHAYVSIPLYGYGLAKNDTVFLSSKGYKEDYDLTLVIK